MAELCLKYRSFDSCENQTLMPLKSKGKVIVRVDRKQLLLQLYHVLNNWGISHGLAVYVLIL